MALHRYGDFRVEVFYFDSPCIRATRATVSDPDPSTVHLYGYLPTYQATTGIYNVHIISVTYLLTVPPTSVKEPCRTPAASTLNI